ncbi:MAG: isoprenylcysteine carboxylmethyltransferase family protein [Gemmatimonadetes bacterium]|nr:isoprenylcysteine carboxylmethyltransferase family protein [Gemmatimonadota bacterium]
MLRVLLRLVADTVVVAAALFGAAGTLAWRRAWLLLAVLLAVRVGSAVAVFRVNPALLRDRATVLVHRDQPWADRLILLAFMATSFLGLPAVAALDVFRWHVLPGPPLPLTTLGLALFALGWVIIALSLRANAFAVAVVRVQEERRHSVADSGVYRVVRHPMYAGSPCVNVGLSLWLGSYAAALLAVVPLGLLVARIGLEERVLRRDLPGYGEYAQRVRYRLLPGIW